MGGKAEDLRASRMWEGEQEVHKEDLEKKKEKAET